MELMRFQFTWDTLGELRLCLILGGSCYRLLIWAWLAIFRGHYSHLKDFQCLQWVLSQARTEDTEKNSLSLLIWFLHSPPLFC